MAESGTSSSPALKGALVVLAVLAVVGLAGFAWVYANMQSESAAWERQRAELEKERDGLKADLAGQREAGAGLEQTVTDLREEIASVHETSLALQVEAQKQMAKIEKMESMSLAEGEAEARLAELEVEIAAKQRALKSIGARLATSQGTIQNALKKRAAANAETTELKGQIAQQKEALAGLERDYQSQRENLGGLEQALRDAHEQLGRSLEQIEKLSTATGG